MLHSARRILMLFCLCWSWYGSSRDTWVLPQGDMRYNALSFLTAHNAFANYNEGWRRYMMQTWSIEEQLDHGVRGLMLDLFDEKGNIVLCHGGCGLFHTAQKGIGVALHSLYAKHEHKTFKSLLELIKEWVERHPEEVVTLFLENRVDNKKLNEEIKAVEGLAPLILTVRDWNPHELSGQWPTLAWMRNENKRIVIFNEDKTDSRLHVYNDPENTEYLFSYGWHYVIESAYGSVDKNAACHERIDSEQFKSMRRLLYLLNFFRTLTGPMAQSNHDNAYETLKEVVDYCQQQDLAGGKSPNFIALDFVEEGNPLKLINELNKKAEGL